MASLVYPGALHTRFEHSIGAMHIAGKIAKHLALTEEEHRLLRLAALLHDIGHGPFSHVSEEVLKGVSGKKQIHELITCDLIMNCPELDIPLSGDDRKQIVGLLNESQPDSLLKGILSGPLDVDKQDYLLRDSYFCGVKYGVYDLDRLVEILCIQPDGYDRQLAITSDGVYVLEQFIIARYHMNTQVYRHRVRQITDSMIVRGIELGLEIDKMSWLKDLYNYEDNEEYRENYLSWDDDRLIFNMVDKSTPEGPSKTIFRRLLARDLFKEILRVNLNDLDLLAKNALLSLDPAKEKQITSGLERAVSDAYSEFEEEFVIVKIIRQKSAGQTEGSVVVRGNDGSLREFREESILFSSIDTRTQEQQLVIFTPMTWADDINKAKRREFYRQELVPLVNDYLKANTGLFGPIDLNP
jgi:HD superfamily phosphohydrolase